MSDTLKKVKPGDPLAIPAATFNTFVDAAQDFLRRQRGIGRTPVADRPSFETVLLKNASGADRSRFDVLGIDAPIFTPTDSLETFTNGIALVGVTPAASHAGNFAVLVEPIQAGQLGRARILGACPVKVNVVSASDAFADVDAGVTSRLKSGSAGAARILWKESGTGEKWAVVKIGAHWPASCDEFAKAQDIWQLPDAVSETHPWVSCVVCDEAGNEAGPSIVVLLPWPDSPTAVRHTRDPNVRTGAIIVARRLATGRWVCASDYLDDPLGTRKVWHDPDNIPGGWERWDGYDGRFLAGFDPDDPDHDFDTVDATGGGKKHTHADHADHWHRLISCDGPDIPSNWPTGPFDEDTGGVRGGDDGLNVLSHSESAHLPPYKVAFWIVRTS